MKKKIFIILGVFILSLVVVGILTNYIDSGRVTTGHEPKFCIKVVSNDGSKVTYWGLGYKVIRYVGVSPKEPYESNIGVKMGSWFMNYNMSEVKNIKVENIDIEKNNLTIITDKKDIEKLLNILENSKYNNELCKNDANYKITVDEEIYYLKIDCKEIKKGNRQAKLSDNDLETILNIIN